MLIAQPTHIPGLTIGTGGTRDTKIMVVGEAPGADELREGQPFVGASGKLLRERMLSAGLDPERTFLTNLCRYRPPGNELGEFFQSDGTPGPKVIEGLIQLKADIDSINPHVILALGNFPLKLLTGRGKWDKKERKFTGIGDYRGYVLDGRAIAAGRKVIASYHPSYCLREYSGSHILRLDIQRLVDESLFPEIRPPLRHRIIIDPCGGGEEGERARAYREWLVSPSGTPLQIGDETFLSGDFLSSDIEYIGSRLLCIGFTRNRNLAIVFPTRTAASIDFIRDILLSGVPLCFQNAMFDCSILDWFYGIAVWRYLKHDTMIAMHACYIEWPKDLGFIGSLQTEWRRMPPWWEGIDGDFWKRLAASIANGENPRPELEAAYLPYNAGDVCVTHEAMESMLADELQDSNFLATYLHEMSLISPLWSISRRGCRVDTQAISTLQATLESESILMEGGLALLNGGVPVGAKQNQKLADLLYNKLGIPRGPKTAPSSRFPEGQWKLDDTTLALLLLKATNDRQRTALRLIRDARTRLDLVSKFCEIELDSDSRMRCHYDPAKTETGRLSSRKFYPTRRGANLQNIPKDTRVRSVFVPDRGYLFGYADLKSAESLVVAHITGDPEMLRLHSSEYMSGGLDGHKYVASFLLDKPIDRITKDERYLGKRCRHAGNYSMGPKKLLELINGDAEETGVSVDLAQATRLIDRYRKLHPFLQNWWNDILATLWDSHTLYTLHGRKRVFYGRPDRVLPDAIAYNPQGTVAQTLNMGLCRMDEDYVRDAYNWQRQWDAANTMMEAAFIEMCGQLQDLGLQMLLQVHDAIGFQVPEKNADMLLPIIPKIMEVPLQISRRGIEPYIITIPVETQVGYNWGEFDPKEPTKNPNGMKVWHG